MIPFMTYHDNMTIIFMTMGRLVEASGINSLANRSQNGKTPPDKRQPQLATASQTPVEVNDAMLKGK